jgi:hypothetical protein
VGPHARHGSTIGTSERLPNYTASRPRGRCSHLHEFRTSSAMWRPPCTLQHVYRRFDGICCLLPQGKYTALLCMSECSTGMRTSERAGGRLRHAIPQLVEALLQAGKVTGSIPDKFTGFLNLHNPFSRTIALGSTQSTRNLRGGVKGGRRVRLTTSPPSVSRVYTTCGRLDISHLYGHLLPVTRITAQFVM